MSKTRHVRVVAPANTMADLPDDRISVGIEKLDALGCSVSFGAHVLENRLRIAGTPEQRVSDLHAAFGDPDVDIVMAVWGGYNSNELLPRLDAQLICGAGKLFIGYSDVTALLFGLYESRGTTALVHGPAFSTFCLPDFSSTTAASFAAVVERLGSSYRSGVGGETIGDSSVLRCSGWNVLRAGSATGPALAGNLDTMTALMGTRYAPKTDGHVLFIDDATGTNPGAFRRDLVQLHQSGSLERIAGLVFGRFPPSTPLSELGVVDRIVAEVLGEGHYPVFTNIDCGHVQPILSIALGWTTRIYGDDRDVLLTLCPPAR